MVQKYPQDEGGGGYHGWFGHSNINNLWLHTFFTAWFGDKGGGSSKTSANSNNANVNTLVNL